MVPADTRPILLVDDRADDRELLRRALRRAMVPNPVVELRGGRELLDWLWRRGAHAARAGAMPVAVLLDLRMPDIDGLQALRRIRADASLQPLPVVIVSGSCAPEDVAASYAGGANSYVAKQGPALDAALERVGSYWTRVNEPPELAPPGTPAAA